jgi:hypothetical protein
VWLNIYRWLGFSIVMPRNFFVLFEYFVGFVPNKKVAKGFALIWLTTVWSIWRSRNEVVFSNGVRDVVKVVDDVKHLSWQWGMYVAPSNPVLSILRMVLLAGHLPPLRVCVWACVVFVWLGVLVLVLGVLPDFLGLLFSCVCGLLCGFVRLGWVCVVCFSCSCIYDGTACTLFSIYLPLSKKKKQH